MLPYSQNPHTVAKLAHEHYRELRREADAWRLAREAQEGREAPCVPAGASLKGALMRVWLRLSGTPRSQIALCP